MLFICAKVRSPPAKTPPEAIVESLCIVSTKCGNDTQTFYNCLRRGFRRGASCICISIKKKAISERYTIKTASRLLQNDIACPADRGGSPTMRTNPGNKMTKRTMFLTCQLVNGMNDFLFASRFYKIAADSSYFRKNTRKH